MGRVRAEYVVLAIKRGDLEIETLMLTGDYLHMLGLFGTKLSSLWWWLQRINSSKLI